MSIFLNISVSFEAVNEKENECAMVGVMSTGKSKQRVLAVKENFDWS